MSWDPQWAAVFYNEHNRIPHHFAAMLAATSSMDTDAEFAQKALEDIRAAKDRKFDA